MLSRKYWRAQGASKYILDGTQHTCMQDSFVVAARYIGCTVTRDEVRWIILNQPFESFLIGHVS
jgi:hypothetical protein